MKCVFRFLNKKHSIKNSRFSFSLILSLILSLFFHFGLFFILLKDSFHSQKLTVGNVSHAKIKVEVRIHQLQKKTYPQNRIDRMYSLIKKETDQSGVPSKKSDFETSTALSDISNNKEDGPGISFLDKDLGINVLYPRLSRVLGESGEVVIAIERQRVSLFSTSGFRRLDDAALKAAQDSLQSGVLAKKMDSQVRVQVRFIFRLVPNKSL